MVEGAIYKVNPLVGEDDSDYVDKWEQDNQEDHSKISPPKQSYITTQSFHFSAFSREKMRYDIFYDILTVDIRKIDAVMRIKTHFCWQGHGGAKCWWDPTSGQMGNY